MKTIYARPRNPEASPDRVHVSPQNRFHIGRLAGPARSRGEGPASPQDSKFKSQCKLNLALAILYLLPHRRGRRLFRERAKIGGIAAENLGTEMHAAVEVRMVNDVEEFGPELHHTGFSEKSDFCVLHE